jgi:ABC-type branched-subunit amino acid transport system ATPase component
LSQRRRQDTIFSLISRIYTPTSGSVVFDGHALTQQQPHKVVSLGIARTFQNIELFEHASALQNLLIGCHAHRSTSLQDDVLFTAKCALENRLWIWIQQVELTDDAFATSRLRAACSF